MEQTPLGCRTRGLELGHEMRGIERSERGGWLDCVVNVQVTGLIIFL